MDREPSTVNAPGSSCAIPPDWSDLVKPSKEVRAFIETRRVARMATVDAAGSPHVVPICYAYDRSRFYSVMDEKPKRVKVSRLKRLVNIEGNARTCLIIDEYDENWGRLRYVMIHGTARIELAGPEHSHALNLLRQKYPQYRTMTLVESVNPVIVMTPTRIVSWGNFDEERSE